VAVSTARLDHELVRHCYLWRAGEAPARVELGGPSAAQTDNGILCIDVDSRGDPSQILDVLRRLCPGLTSKMIAELLDEEEFCEASTYEDGAIKVITTCAVSAESPEPQTGASTGWLIVEPVELLAGRTWLVTCWHQPRAYTGRRQPRPGGDPGDCLEVFEAVGARWRPTRGSTGGDLGIQIMQQLALGYARAHRAVYRWLEEWEMNLYEHRLDSLDLIEQERDALRRLWGLRASLRDWISPLNRPGLRLDLNEAWLPARDHDAVIALDERIDKVLSALARLGETLRGSFQLLHLQQHDLERDQITRRQQQIEVAAAIFLAPTLVVGLYGANTWLPGEHRQWGFWIMLAIVVVMTSVTLFLIRRIHRNQPSASRPPLSREVRSQLGR
jgi:CorA-like Mg2+ transporter protein